MTEYSLKAKLSAEFIGTFFLCFAINITAIHGIVSEYAPYVIAFVLMSMIYTTSFISGAHFNPVVTLALWLRGGTPHVFLPFPHERAALSHARPPILHPEL